MPDFIQHPSPAQQFILIVEDDVAVANDLRRILERAGYVVSGVAADGTQALDFIGQQRPSLVLLDIHLPGLLTSIDLARQLHENQIPFVSVSPSDRASILEEVQTAKPDGLITKPFVELDVLLALELAQFRYAHGIETRVQHEQALQIALTDALSGEGTWDERLLMVTKLLQPHIPFDWFFMGLLRPHGAHTFRSCSFLRVGPDEYETVWGRDYTQKAGLVWDKAVKVVNEDLYEEAEICNGEDFVAVCARNSVKQSLAQSYQLRSNLMIPLKTAQHGTFLFSFYSHQPYSYQPRHLQLLKRIEPSLTLTLDRLMAFEKLEASEQVKSAELAIIQAFTSGKGYPEVTELVAIALNKVIPCDLFSVYRAGMKLEKSMIDSSVVKKEGQFVPFSLLDLLPTPAVKPQWQEKLDEVTGLFDQAGLYMGEEYTRISHQNEIVRFYSDALGLRCCMIVPMTVDGHPAASLVLASRSTYSFTLQDFELFQRLCMQMSLGFENRMAFERIEALRHQLEQENAYLLEEVKTGADFEQIIGESPLLFDVFKSVGQVAPTDYTVLILGETGTGKELIARALHNRSDRKAKPLIKLNCAALPPQLIESELFGHEKGAFTGALERRIGKFELANGGTIFLDEIGELPLELQPKLLRVLQEKEIERIGGKSPIPCDIRIIAATNRLLQQEVAEGRFRADLFYRLNVFPIRLPALRERLEDLIPLSSYFLQKIAKKLGKRLTGISESSLRQMRAYSWPGNIRELEHLLERAAIMATTPIVSLAEPLGPDPSTSTPDSEPISAPGVKPYEQAERDNILAALELTHYRIRGKNGAAELLKLKPTTLEARMARLGISR